MVMAASNWESEDHMMLVRCVSDSLDMSVLGGVLDRLDQASITLPMGQLIDTLISCGGIVSLCNLLQGL